MTLSLVIPVWNDAEPLARLLRAVAGLGCLRAVIVVDDGSDPPLAIDRVAPPGWDGRIRLLRVAEGPRGAGAARNLGLDAVETPHVLFFDADDRPTGELDDLMRDLVGRSFDFCMFRHADSRTIAEGGWGQMPQDEALWQAAGVAMGAIRAPDAAARARLAETANYPWNKIYRTAFLRDHAIRCSETRVHNDIALHWDSFRLARQVLTSDRVAAVHYVDPAGGRLTNRRGAERLELFSVLGPLAGRILDDRAPDDPLARAFLRFSAGLIDWAAGLIDPALAPAFETARRGLLARHLGPVALARLAGDDPALALRLIGGGAP